MVYDETPWKEGVEVQVSVEEADGVPRQHPAVHVPQTVVTATDHLVELDTALKALSCGKNVTFICHEPACRSLVDEEVPTLAREEPVCIVIQTELGCGLSTHSGGGEARVKADGGIEAAVPGPGDIVEVHRIGRGATQPGRVQHDHL